MSFVTAEFYRKKKKFNVDFFVVLFDLELNESLMLRRVWLARPGTKCGLIKQLSDSNLTSKPTGQVQRAGSYRDLFYRKYKRRIKESTVFSSC